MIQAVVFDLWNTLVFNPRGNPFDALKLVTHNPTEADMFEHHVMRTAYGSLGEARQKGPALVFRSSESEKNWTHDFEASDTEVTLFEDSLLCLQEATSLVRLGLLTNTQSFGLNFLGRLGLSEKIPYRFISADLGLAKPDPNIFNYAQKSLGLFPGDLVMVGDTWNDDIEGALAAGWSAIWLNRKGQRAPRQDLGPDFAEINSLEALPSVIRNLQAGLRCAQCLG